MKITSIRIKGQKPTGVQLVDIMYDLKKRFQRAGFITGIEVKNTTSLKVGQHMRSFSLDITKHDRNLQCSPYANKLTNLPTWDQRVEFNNIINSVLNKYKVSANISSGPYTIRKGLVNFGESDWHNQTPEYIRHNHARGYCIESVDEVQYLDEKRLQNNAKAKQRRLDKKAQQASQQ